MSRAWIVVGVVVLCVFAFSTSAATCLGGTAVSLNGVKLEATAGGMASAVVANPFAGDNDLTGRTGKLCWLTAEQAAGNTSCAAATPRHPSVDVFELERCNGTARVLVGQGTDVSQIASWGELIVRYAPATDEPAADAAVLRLEFSKTGSPDVVRQFFVKGNATAGFDPLYRLMTFLGTTSTFSQDDFGKNHPELRLLVESRLVDGYEKCLSKNTVEECGKRGARRFSFPDYYNLRIYGDAGLTSTTATPTGGSPTFESKRAFDGSAGVGIGGSYNRATRPGNRYTNRFSYSIVAKAGQITIPTEVAGQSGDHFHNNVVGMRFENENGYFEGAYFETGVGRSDQFNYHRHNRWKSDGYLPFFRPGTVRLATRVQVDIPAPWSDLGDENNVVVDGVIVDAKEGRRLLRAGDVKISFLLSIDIKRVFGFAGAILE
ncbi:MAG TPA: hypothetical protein VGQ36_22355 [Thermoanaerobaculia bacterium]|jgi:hypothetical protein|nr:hypothetical protein [Thermoanaerobaculia bacterium]